MELSKAEYARCKIDQEYDDFLDFVEVERIGNQRIVHREGNSWLGVIDESENILLPLIYDNLIPNECGIRTVIESPGSVLNGLYSIDDRTVILPAIYNTIYPAINCYWCLKGKQWELVTHACEVIMKLPHNALPLNHYKYICILRKTSVGLKIEVFDEVYNHSQSRLREIAHESNIPNRIRMVCRYCNLIVYSDIYGNVIYSNVDIDDILSAVK
jgi:hypothetical protein